MIVLFPSRTVALEIFGFGIHWYGLMYLTAFLLAYALLPRLQRHRDLNFSREDWADLLTAAVIGVIVGGRLGYVLFYSPLYYSAHPLEIFAVWQGGMSSHGGFVGVTIACAAIMRKRNMPVLAVADIMVVPIALGLALGRMGNFINQELYGTVTTLPWGIKIPGMDGFRHPTQLYAVVKDLAIAAVCLWYLTSVRPVKVGRALSLFLILYAVLRFLLEFLRVQEHGDILGLTRGQILTIPVFCVGVWLWMNKRSSV